MLVLLTAVHSLLNLLKPWTEEGNDLNLEYVHATDTQYTQLCIGLLIYRLLAKLTSHSLKKR